MSWIDEIVSSSAAPGSVFLATEAEFLSASSSDSIGRTVKLRIVRPPKDQHLANPFSSVTRRRGKRAGTRFDASIVDVATQESKYTGEVMLLNWASGPSGDNVTLLINFIEDETDGHPFLLCKRPSAGAPGTRFMCVFVTVGDDEQVVVDTDKPADARVDTRSQQPLSVQAAMLTKQPAFHDFLRETVNDSQWNTADADRWIKTACSINSKSELVENQKAASIFKKILWKYSDWRDPDGRGD